MTDIDNNNLFMSEPELAQLLRRTPGTVAAWAKAGTGPCPTHVGGRRLYRRSTVAEWLKCQERREPEQLEMIFDIDGDTGEAVHD